MAANGSRRSEGQARKVAALSRLLQQECVRLLELYRERESLPSFPDSGAQLVRIPPLSSHLSSTERLCFLHSALKACLHLLKQLIKREDAEFPEEEEELEYHKQRKIVEVRLEHMLVSMERLLGDSSVCEADVTEIPDSVDTSTFALKKWSLQVLQDLVHWSSQTLETLQSLQVEREKAPTRASRVARRQNRRLHK